jgi:hypothetical protein
MAKAEKTITGVVTMTQAQLDALLAGAATAGAAKAAKAEKAAKAAIANARRVQGFHRLPLTGKDRDRNVCGSAVHVIMGIGRIGARVRIVRQADGSFAPDYQYGNGTAFSNGLVAPSGDAMTRVLAAMADRWAETREYLEGEYNRLSPDWSFSTKAPAADDGDDA